MKEGYAIKGTREVKNGREDTGGRNVRVRREGWTTLLLIKR